MKIAFYINAIHEGGAERVMVNLASNFANEGDDVILITSFKDSWEYPYSTKIKRYILEENKTFRSKIKRNIFRILELRKILKVELPDCIVSFMAEPNYRAIIASYGLKTKTIISVRNDPNKEYPGKIGKFLGKNLLPLADGCVFQTAEAQHWFPEKLQYKSKIIFNAVKKDFFEVNRQVVKDTIVTCGRLEEQKNHKLLINAFKLVLKKHPDAKLMIYGEGMLRNDLDELIKSKGMDQNVLLCGNSNNVPEVLSKAEIFVLSSDYEGMPNALMEALAAGVPCISTDCPCGGPKSLITDKVNGRLISVNNQEQLANVLDELLDNKEIATKLGAEAQKQAFEFSPIKIYEIWHKYVEFVVYS